MVAKVANKSEMKSALLEEVDGTWTRKKTFFRDISFIRIVAKGEVQETANPLGRTRIIECKIVSEVRHLRIKAFV